MAALLAAAEPGEIAEVAREMRRRSELSRREILPRSCAAPPAVTREVHACCGTVGLGLGLGLGWGWLGGDEQRACRPRPEAFRRGRTAVSVEWAPWA